MPSIVGDHWYGEARRHPAQPPPTRRARQPRFDSPALAAAAQLTRIVRRRPVCRVQAQARLATRTRGAVVPDPRGRTISMRYPQVTDRMKEAPIKALRAIFAGFRQVLLVADPATCPGPARAGGGSGAGPAPAGRGAAPAETDAAPPEADDALAETAAAAPETAAAAPQADAEGSDSGIAGPGPHVGLARA